MFAFLSHFPLARPYSNYGAVTRLPGSRATGGTSRHVVVYATHFRSSRYGNDFESFDGSQPLLPPWRPSTPEEDFGYHGNRARARERAAEEFRRIVSVSATDDDGDVLFAEVVQDIGRDGRMWVRPLLLMNRTEDIWRDMRGTVDVLLPSDCVVEPDVATRTLVTMSIAASEHDFYDRFLDDDGAIHENCRVLSAFIQSLSIET